MADLPAHVKLWVAGDGPDTGALQAKVAGDPRIEWLGRVSDTEKAARMRGATVLCAPSLRGESFGVVLLEAMAAGSAVVASDLAGYRNVATDEKDALLVTPGDAALLAKSIRRVIDDSDLAQRLRDAGRARAEVFSMVSLTDCYLAIYNRLVDAAPVVTRRRRLIG
jgi:phosphatidylinositol alpha-mannosyltransferase